MGTDKSIHISILLLLLLSIFFSALFYGSFPKTRDPFLPSMSSRLWGLGWIWIEPDNFHATAHARSHRNFPSRTKEQHYRLPQLPTQSNCMPVSRRSIGSWWSFYFYFLGCSFFFFCSLNTFFFCFCFVMRLENENAHKTTSPNKTSG